MEDSSWPTVQPTQWSFKTIHETNCQILSRNQAIWTSRETFPRSQVSLWSIWNVNKPQKIRQCLWIRNTQLTQKRNYLSLLQKCAKVRVRQTLKRSRTTLPESERSRPGHRHVPQRQQVGRHDPPGATVQTWPAQGYVGLSRTHLAEGRQLPQSRTVLHRRWHVDERMRDVQG